jgi:hypothetical protein
MVVIVYDVKLMRSSSGYTHKPAPESNAIYTEAHIPHLAWHPLRDQRAR